MFSLFVILVQMVFAYPQGPNVSLGANPIWNYIGTCDNLNYTVPVGSTLIITDIQKVSTSTSYWVRVKLDGVNFFNTYSTSLLTYSTGVRAEANQVLTCQRGSYDQDILLMGYFTAP